MCRNVFCLTLYPQLDTFDPSASRFGTPLRRILGTDIHIVQSPTMLHVGVAPTVRSIFPSTYSAQVLTMERRITRYFLFHGVLIIFMLAGKILSSTYNTIRMILGADLGDVIAIVLFMACAWAISHHFLQDWEADVGQISDLVSFSVWKCYPHSPAFPSCFLVRKRPLVFWLFCRSWVLHSPPGVFCHFLTLPLTSASGCLFAQILWFITCLSWFLTFCCGSLSVTLWVQSFVSCSLAYNLFWSQRCIVISLQRSPDYQTEMSLLPVYL